MNRTSLAALAAALGAAALAACHSKLECPVGETGCLGRCVDLATSAQSCGACGFACSSGACRDGACVCPPGKIECGGGCVDLASDPAHCGACGTACAPAQACSAARCEAACADGLEACGRACVDLASDRWHCGACAVGCAPGQSCDAGTCRTLAVACFATDEIRTVSPDLAWVGPPVLAGDGPASLDVLDGTLFGANSISHSLTAVSLAGPSATELRFAGRSDFEHVAAHAGRLFVSASGDGTLLVVDPATGDVLDTVVLGETRVNPLGLAFVGDRAYVTLYGQSALGEGEAQAGQAVAVVDFAGVEGCTGAPCGTLLRTIPLAAGADPGGFPFPSRAVAVGAKVYVTLANLKKGASGYYTDPAGNGKLAVIDSAASDALSFLDLGAGCLNPGGVAARDTTVWVACGAAASQAIVPVDVAGPAPVVRTPVATPSPTPGAFAFVPGSVAFCGGMGYVTDQWSGDLIRFDPAHPAAQAGMTVCPLNAPPQEFGWAWAADVACAP